MLQKCHPFGCSRAVSYLSSVSVWVLGDDGELRLDCWRDGVMFDQFARLGARPLLVENDYSPLRRRAEDRQTGEVRTRCLSRRRVCEAGRAGGLERGKPQAGVRFFGYFLAAQQERNSPAGARPGNTGLLHRKNQQPGFPLARE